MVSKYIGLLITLVFVGVLGFFMVFSTTLIYEAGAEYIVNPVHNVTSTIANETIAPSLGINAAMDEAKTFYAELIYPVDLFFLAFLLGVIVTTFWSAFTFPRVGLFSFVGLLFIGSLFALFLTLFIQDFVSWGMTELFDRLFSSSTITTPIFDYYVLNMGWINFVWWLGLVLAALLDKTYISNAGNVEE